MGDMKEMSSLSTERTPLLTYRSIGKRQNFYLSAKLHTDVPEEARLKNQNKSIEKKKPNRYRQSHTAGKTDFTDTAQPIQRESSFQQIVLG